MIAVDLNQERVVFHKNTTSEQRYQAIKNLYYHSPVLMRYMLFPVEDLILLHRYYGGIPTVWYYKPEKNYEAYS